MITIWETKTITRRGAAYYIQAVLLDHPFVVVITSENTTNAITTPAETLLLFCFLVLWGRETWGKFAWEYLTCILMPCQSSVSFKTCTCRFNIKSALRLSCPSGKCLPLWFSSMKTQGLQRINFVLLHLICQYWGIDTHGWREGLCNNLIRVWTHIPLEDCKSQSLTFFKFFMRISPQEKKV